MTEFLETARVDGGIATGKEKEESRTLRPGFLDHPPADAGKQKDDPTREA
jgi:hypothetical protein